MVVNREKKLFLPMAGSGAEEERTAPQEVVGDAPCPCCGCLTIPNHGDALAYICPVCAWEIDLFLRSDGEPSDQNHGLTLAEARKNYAAMGASDPRSKKFCRPPKDRERPER